MHGKTKIIEFWNLIFGNLWGPEVVESSLYQKNIGMEFTHLYLKKQCGRNFFKQFGFRGQREQNESMVFQCLPRLTQLPPLFSWHSLSKKYFDSVKSRFFQQNHYCKLCTEEAAANFCRAIITIPLWILYQPCKLLLNFFRKEKQERP